MFVIILSMFVHYFVNVYSFLPLFSFFTFFKIVLGLFFIFVRFSFLSIFFFHFCQFFIFPLIFVCYDFFAKFWFFSFYPREKYVSCLWGAWHSGSVGVPLSVKNPIGELEYVLDNSQPTNIYASSLFIDKLGEANKTFNINTIKQNKLKATVARRTHKLSSRRTRKKLQTFFYEEENTIRNY